MSQCRFSARRIDKEIIHPSFAFPMPIAGVDLLMARASGGWPFIGRHHVAHIGFDFERRMGHHRRRFAPPALSPAAAFMVRAYRGYRKMIKHGTAIISARHKIFARVAPAAPGRVVIRA